MQFMTIIQKKNISCHDTFKMSDYQPPQRPTAGLFLISLFSTTTQKAIRLPSAVHLVLYSVCCTLDVVQQVYCILDVVQQVYCTLGTVQYLLYTWYCVVFTAHWIQYSKVVIQLAVYHIYCTLDIVHYIGCTLDCYLSLHFTHHLYCKLYY